jgi:hypothetical protein
VIDVREQNANAFASTRVNSQLNSKEIDESDLQFEKHDKQRRQTVRGIVTDLIHAPSNARSPIRVTTNVAAREGKNTNEGILMSIPRSNPTTVADPSSA